MIHLCLFLTSPIYSKSVVIIIHKLTDFPQVDEDGGLTVSTLNFCSRTSFKLAKAVKEKAN